MPPNPPPDPFLVGNERQQPQQQMNAPDMAGIQTALQAGNQNVGRFIQAVQGRFPSMSPLQSALGILYSSAGGTTIAQGSGVNGAGSDYLMSVHVTVPCTGTAVGYIYDANSPANVSTANRMAILPSSGQATYNYPFVNGLTIAPTSVSGQQVAVYYINRTSTGV